MLVTRSGASYNMSNNQNPNDPNPNNQNSSSEDTNYTHLQTQIEQITRVLAQISHRLDVMDERNIRDERGPFDRRQRFDEHEAEQEFERYEHRHREYGPNFHHRNTGPNSSSRHLDELTKRMKVDVPDFFGKIEPNAFEDWLTSIEDYFDWFDVSADRKVRYVRMKLKGHARAWWGSVEEQLRCTRRPAVSNWEEIKERLKEKYLPIDYEQMMFEEMLQLSQGSLSVDKFTERFHELTVRSKIVETEQQTLARYRAGLRTEIRKDMSTARLINVEEAYQLALRLEKQTGLGRNTILTDSKSERLTTPPTYKSITLKHQSRGTSGNLIEKAKTASEGPQCYKCKGFGNYAVVCPTRDKKLALICEKELLVVDTIRDSDGDEIESDNNESEEHLSASTLPSCVIHRVLTGTTNETQENPEWLRNNIFHTRFEHNGRALNVIIDNGSGMNAISKTAVKKLGLKTEKHPTPYHISWVNSMKLILFLSRSVV